MRIPDEMVMAYVDGELDPADAARVEAAIAGDPDLAAAVARHRALRRRLGAAYAPVLDEPVPERLLAAARREAVTTSKVTEIRAAAAARATVPRRRWSWPEWGAMAASLLLGALFSQTLVQREQPALVSAADGVLRARGALADELNGQLAAAPVESGLVAVGLSFRASSGEYCRTFVLRQQQALAGLACRSGDQWQVPVLTQTRLPASGDLRLASTALPAAVLGEVDARIDGEPLDADAERAARDAGWR